MILTSLLLYRRQLFYPLNYGGIRIGSTVTFHYHVDIPPSLGDFIYPALTSDACLRHPCPLCRSNIWFFELLEFLDYTGKISKPRHVSNLQDIGRLRFHPDGQSIWPYVCLAFATTKQSTVPEVGVEPTRPKGHRFLRPTRIPIPPLGHLLYPRRDSNPHATVTSHLILSQACLPIPPRGHDV